jgi:hypothetical protein
MNQFSRIVVSASIMCLLVVVAMGLCSCSKKAGGMTYDEFVKAACQEEQNTRCETTKEELFKRVGEPDRIARPGGGSSYIYLYYDLRGGQAVVKALSGRWATGRALFFRPDISYVGEYTNPD